MTEKPNEYQCEHLAFLSDAEGPMFMVKVQGHERHWYLRLSPAQALLVSADSTSYVCTEMQRAMGKSPLE
jgi:hypothetical protein